MDNIGEVGKSEVRKFITPALPEGSAYPLILRGLLYGKCDPTRGSYDEKSETEKFRYYFRQYWLILPLVS
jgi:hypothetical protein